MDAYAIYSKWWKDHYGYEFPCSREDWQRWCEAPRFREGTDFDIDTERREGWAYGDGNHG